MVINNASMSLRFVEIEDAEFIHKLRNNDKLNKFLSKTSGDINDQREWIKNYKIREKEKIEYYFVIENCKIPIGVIRVYNIKNDTLEWGSWILDPEMSNPIFAIKSILMIYEFIFEVLKYNNLHLEVRKGNKEVVMFHKGYGAIIASEDLENYYFEFNKIRYESMKKKYKRYL